MVVVAFVFVIGMAPFQFVMTAGAASNQDPFVYAIVGYRHQNATTATNYDYGINATIANQGTVDYTDDNWYIHYTVFNSADQTGTEGNSPLLTEDLPANLGVAKTFHAYFFNFSTYWCCVKAELKLPDPNHDDNTDNDVKGNNTLNLATHASNIVNNHVAAHNHRGYTINFNVGVPDLPPGWTVNLNRSSLYIASGDVGYVDIAVIAPGEITNWPDFHIGFTGATDHSADQDTHIWMRADNVYATSCMEALLL